MNRRMTYAIAVLASLMWVSTGFGQAGTAPRRSQPAQEPAAQRQEPSAEQQVQTLQQQIDDLRTAHQELIDQLTALHASAAKEKATATAGAIEKIVSRQQELFQNQVRQLQRQQQALRQTITERTGTTGRVPRQPRKAQEFELKTFDGKTVKLSDYKGKIIVLEWMNLDCPFSMYHHKTKSTMVDLANKYKDKDVVWLAINSTSTTTPQANLDFVKEQKLPYPILDDRSGRVGRLYGAQKTPHIFIIDKQGILVYEGAIDNAPMGKIEEGPKVINYVDQDLAALVGGKPAPVPITLPYGCSVKYATP